jgi:hypothetical protein
MKTKQGLILALLVFVVGISVWADMPGNKPRPSVYVHVVLGDSVKGYQFLMMRDDGEAETKLDSDTIWLNGGMGKPDAVFIWAVNKKTKQNTDTLSFFNDEQHRTVNIQSIFNNKLVVAEGSLAAKSDYDETETADTNEVVPPIKKANLLLYFSGAALLLLIGYFIWRKRNGTK